MIALATLPNIKYPSDIVPSEKFYHVDLCGPEIRMAGPCRIMPSSAPGVGIAPYPDRLERMCTNRAVIKKA